MYIFSNIINADCKRSDKEILFNSIKNLEDKIIIVIADLQDKLDDSEKDVINNIPITINELSKRKLCNFCNKFLHSLYMSAIES